MNGNLAAVVSYAKGALGDPYVWGATGPDSFDCSGLTKAAYAAAGVDLPHLASAQGKLGRPVSLSAAPIGALVYLDEPGSTDHVGILVDKANGGHMIDAPTRGQPVGVHSIAGFTSIRDLGVPETSSGGVATSPAFYGAGVSGEEASITDPSSWLPAIERLALMVGGGAIAGALVIVGLKTTVRGGGS